jgi:hypothetical protein
MSHPRALQILVRAEFTRLLLMLTVGTGALALFRSPLPNVNRAVVLTAVREVLIGLMAGLGVASAVARPLTRRAIDARMGHGRARTDWSDVLLDVDSALSRVVFLLVAWNLLGYGFGYIVGYALVNPIAAMIIYKRVVRQNREPAEELVRLVSARRADSAEGVLLFAGFLLLQAGLVLRRTMDWTPPITGGLLLAVFLAAGTREACGGWRRRGQEEPTWALLLPSAMLVVAGLLGLARLVTCA